jgi:RNA polymerase sigma factor (sigma-70 family)
MNGDTTGDVRDLIERLRNGDDAAQRDLLERVYHRLRRITAGTLRKEFPRLLARQELNSIVDEAWMRLRKALEGTRPESAEAFYGLMFCKVRQLLFDIARRQDREDARRQDAPRDLEGSGSEVRFDVEDSTYEPSRLAVWTEIHREFENLPDDQRTVFDFHYFAEFPQSEIARLMDLHPKQVSRLWIAATRQLAQRLHGLEELI